MVYEIKLAHRIQERVVYVVEATQGQDSQLFYIHIGCSEFGATISVRDILLSGFTELELNGTMAISLREALTANWETPSFCENGVGNEPAIIMEYLNKGIVENL